MICGLHNDKYTLFWSVIYFGLRASINHYKWLCIWKSKLKFQHSAPKIISSYHKGPHTFDNLYQRSSRTWYTGNQKPWDIFKLEGKVAPGDTDTWWKVWWLLWQILKNSKFVKYRFWSDQSMISPVSGSRPVWTYHHLAFLRFLIQFGITTSDLLQVFWMDDIFVFWAAISEIIRGNISTVLFLMLMWKKSDCFNVY